jgi:hypothetical protein
MLAVAAAFYEEVLICALLAFALAFNAQVREKDKREGNYRDKHSELIANSSR